VINETEQLGRLLEAGRFDAAETKIKEVKDPATKLYWQSLFSFYNGKYRDAYGEIESALSYKGSEQKWESLKNYYYFISEISYNFQESESDHFRFRAMNQDIVLSRYALDALEKMYQKTGLEFGFYPKNKVLVEIYQNKHDFSIASTLSEEILDKTGTVGICKFNRLMIISPQALPTGYSWLDTLCHEYTHYMVNSLSGGKCPLWLHEGIARYYESAWRTDNYEFLSEAGEQKLKEAKDKNAYISFERMSPSLVYLKNQDEIMLAFSEVASAVDFMRKNYGRDIVGKLLKNIDISDEKTAFKNSLGGSRNNFENLWIKYMKTLDLKAHPGVVVDEVNFNKKNEDEFVGTDAKGYIRLGDKMREIERYDAALIHYNKALDLEPSNPVILLKIARTLVKLGNKQEAEEKLKAAIEKNPHYVTPFQGLSKLYFEENEIDKCMEISLKSLAINPFFPDTHKYLYKCYLSKNDLDNALYEIRAAVVLNPNDAESKVILDRLK
jgi:tetratricopeptide (TPR) repeat protein